MPPVLTHRAEVLAAVDARHEEILTSAALDFVGRLHAAFEKTRQRLLLERRRRALHLASGAALDFSPATAGIRRDPRWRVAPPPTGLTDQRVQLFGPPTAAAAATARTSGAQVWTADLATVPGWPQLLHGQQVLRDLAAHHPHASASSGPHPGEALPATLVVRPRAWHLTEEHLRLEGRTPAAALVDAGLFLFHCARRLLDIGRGPYLCLPQVANRYEARLWNDVLRYAEELLDLPTGSVRASVPIESVTAAFELDEILYELRERASALSASYLPYLASVIQHFAHRPDFVLPERHRTPLTAPFLQAATELLVQTCHKRGAHALGPPLHTVAPDPPQAHGAAMHRVRCAVERTAAAGFDGAQVTDAAWVPLCREVFEGVLGEHPHQIEQLRGAVRIDAADLLAIRRTSGPPSEEGVRHHLALALTHLAGWLRGRATAEWHGEREDADTALSARTQLWQWVRHGAVARGELRAFLDTECAALASRDPQAPVRAARELLERAVVARELPTELNGPTTHDGLMRKERR